MRNLCETLLSEVQLPSKNLLQLRPRTPSIYVAFKLDLNLKLKHTEFIHGQVNKVVDLVLQIPKHFSLHF